MHFTAYRLLLSWLCLFMVALFISSSLLSFVCVDVCTPTVRICFRGMCSNYLLQVVFVMMALMIALLLVVKTMMLIVLAVTVWRVVLGNRFLKGQCPFVRIFNFFGLVYFYLIPFTFVTKCHFVLSSSPTWYDCAVWMGVIHSSLDGSDAYFMQDWWPFFVDVTLWISGFLLLLVLLMGYVVLWSFTLFSLLFFFCCCCPHPCCCCCCCGRCCSQLPLLLLHLFSLLLAFAMLLLILLWQSATTDAAAVFSLWVLMVSDGIDINCGFLLSFNVDRKPWGRQIIFLHSIVTYNFMGYARWIISDMIP